MDVRLVAGGGLSNVFIIRSLWDCYSCSVSSSPPTMANAGNGKLELCLKALCQLFHFDFFCDTTGGGHLCTS